MKKIAVILFGPPGSGKSTQAKLLANRFGLIHFDTGAFIEDALYGPGRHSDALIKKQRQLFESGALLDSHWVLRLVKAQTKKIQAAGFGVVYSGSPRTAFEAAGDARTEGLLPFLFRLYGSQNIFVFALNLSVAESIRRNRVRLIEPLLDLPLMGTVGSFKISPFTGAKLLKRKGLDEPAVIKARLKAYQKQTLPLATEFKKHNLVIKKINGSPLPFQVFESILRRIK